MTAMFVVVSANGLNPPYSNMLPHEKMTIEIPSAGGFMTTYGGVVNPP
jgi:hypothetical protein